MPSNSLQMIVWHYIAYMQNAGLPIDDNDIVDIFLHGSTSNYYYDDTSDIDICIVMDVERLSAALRGINIYTITKALQIAWMRKHKIRIYGRGVDISIVDVRQPKYGPDVYKVGPAYSLPRDMWLRRPCVSKTKKSVFCGAAPGKYIAATDGCSVNVIKTRCLIHILTHSCHGYGPSVVMPMIVRRFSL